MPFGKYHLVVFKDKTSWSKNIRIRAWFIFLLVLTFFALIYININLWQFYQKSKNLEVLLQIAERQSQTQEVEMKSMLMDLDKVRAELLRVQEFDIKLKSMMSLTDEQGATSNIQNLNITNLPLYRQDLASRKIRNFLRDLSEEIYLEEVNQQSLLLSLRNNYNDLAVIPSIMPTIGMLSSPYGNRTSPFTGKTEFHRGIDISNKQGTPIFSTAKGVVSFASTDGAYGNSVEITHGNDIMTKYAHLQRFVVTKGQVVERGEVIGFMGRTGRVTGNHLHYEVRIKGATVNPQKYILN